MSQISIIAEDDQVVITIACADEAEADAAFDSLSAQLAKGFLHVEVLPPAVEVS